MHSKRSPPTKKSRFSEVKNSSGAEPPDVSTCLTLVEHHWFLSDGLTNVRPAASRRCTGGAMSSLKQAGVAGEEGSEEMRDQVQQEVSSHPPARLKAVVVAVGWPLSSF
jgi:hypothetical protein